MITHDTVAKLILNSKKKEVFWIKQDVSEKMVVIYRPYYNCLYQETFIFPMHGDLWDTL